jgi:hypothetical protein
MYLELRKKERHFSKSLVRSQVSTLAHCIRGLSSLAGGGEGACKDLMMFGHSRNHLAQLGSNQLAMGLDLPCTKLCLNRPNHSCKLETLLSTPLTPTPAQKQQQRLTCTLLLPNSATWSIYAFTASVTNTSIRYVEENYHLWRHVVR